MSRRRRSPPTPPDLIAWTPSQALAAFEAVDQLRDLIWETYGPAIQFALKDHSTAEPQRQLAFVLADPEPF